MADRSFNLDKLRRDERRSDRSLKGVAILLFGAGLGIIAMSFVCESLDKLRMGLVGLAVLVLSIPLSLYANTVIKRFVSRQLQGYVQANLFEHGLLALVLQENASEVLPSLMIRESPYSKRRRPPRSMQECLGSLQMNYPKVCRDAGLKPYSRGFYGLHLVIQIAGIAMLTVGSIYAYVRDIYGEPQFLELLFFGCFFCLAGVSNLMRLHLDGVVGSELIAALELDETKEPQIHGPEPR